MALSDVGVQTLDRGTGPVMTGTGAAAACLPFSAWLTPLSDPLGPIPVLADGKVAGVHGRMTLHYSTVCICQNVFVRLVADGHAGGLRAPALWTGPRRAWVEEAVAIPSLRSVTLRRARVDENGEHGTVAPPTRALRGSLSLPGHEPAVDGRVTFQLVLNRQVLCHPCMPCRTMHAIPHVSFPLCICFKERSVYVCTYLPRSFFFTGF